MSAGGLSRGPPGVGMSSHALPASHVLPPTPHPHPFRRLRLCVTDAGILVRNPTSTTQAGGDNDDVGDVQCVLVGWGVGGAIGRAEWKNVKDEVEGLDSENACEVHGVIGILKMYRSKSSSHWLYRVKLGSFLELIASYLLVISSISTVGQCMSQFSQPYSHLPHSNPLDSSVWTRYIYCQVCTRDSAGT